jgi:hypothetical protein
VSVSSFCIGRRRLIFGFPPYDIPPPRRRSIRSFTVNRANDIAAPARLYYQWLYRVLLGGGGGGRTETSFHSYPELWECVVGRQTGIRKK